jgi:TDG/mug DNA glycosylase family protein
MLPDFLAPNLSVIFCGTAAGKVSAAVGHYYAKAGNKFWKTIHAIGITDRLLRAEDDRECLSYGFGFTDLAKGVSGMDRDVGKHAFEPQNVHAIIRIYRPRAIAFNGKRAAQIALDKKVVTYGLLKMQGPTSVWILPSTSGAANRYWSLSPWEDMANFVGSKQA